MPFRGYGPATIGATGLLAVAVAALQLWLVPDPASQPFAYVALWIVTAAMSLAMIGYETVTRSRRIHSDLADDMIRAAIGQFMPTLIAGALVTAVLLRFAPQTTWMLPGFWQVLLGLGVFASCRSLPPAMMLVGGWYLATGLLCLAFASGDQAFSPWAMGVPLGFGQLLSAAVIHSVGGGDAED
jgi:hypothetical protein